MESIIIFDGECNLCNGVVGWLLKSAPKKHFDFVPFQSNRGQQMLEHLNLPTQELTTVLLLDENGTHSHSNAFLKIIAKIPEWQLTATLLAFVPRVVRDTIYNLASKNRVRWFGKSRTCVVSF